MIITVQGYKGKKNNATQLIASLAAMMAMKFNTKNLVIELIGRNIETVESMLIGVGMREQIGKVTYVDQGIDSLLREANVGKLVKSDFDQYCLPIIKNENALDICTVTSDPDNERFLRSLDGKIDTIKRIIESAQTVYDNIFILLPSERSMDEFRMAVKSIPGPDEKHISHKDKRTGKTITETINLPLVDVSIVCLHQAHMKENTIEGRRVIYCVTKFDENSWFNLQNMAQNFGFSRSPLDTTEKYKFCKVSNCTQCNDAGLRGKLATFVHENRELNIEDVNYLWTYDILNLIELITGEKKSSFITDTSWEFEKLYQKAEMLNELEDKIQEKTSELLSEDTDSPELERIDISETIDYEDLSENDSGEDLEDVVNGIIHHTEENPDEESNAFSITDDDVESVISKLAKEQEEEEALLLQKPDEEPEDEPEDEEEPKKKRGVFGFRKKDKKEKKEKIVEVPMEETATKEDEKEKAANAIVDEILNQQEEVSPALEPEEVEDKTSVGEVKEEPASSPVGTPQANPQQAPVDLNMLATVMATSMAQAMATAMTQMQIQSQGQKAPDDKEEK